MDGWCPRRDSSGVMAPHNPDPPTQTAMVRAAATWPSRFEGPIVHVVRDTQPVPVPLPTAPTLALSGWQVVTMFTVAVAGLTVAASLADSTALALVSSSVTSLATGFFFGRRS